MVCTIFDHWDLAYANNHLFASTCLLNAKQAHPVMQCTIDDRSPQVKRRLDDIFDTHLVAHGAAWRSLPDAEPCLGTLQRVAQIAVASNRNQGQQEEKV